MDPSQTSAELQWISPCRIPGLGLLYAPRMGREAKRLTVLPGGSPRDAKIEEQATGARAVRTQCRPKQSRNQNALHRRWTVVSVTIVLGLASRGREPECRAEPVTLQEPATATPLPAKTPRATPPGLDTAALRAETLERLKVV